MSGKQRKTKKETPGTKIALITGANSGIGYGVAQRLLDHSAKNPDEQFEIVLACRNETRATSAKNELLKEFPTGLVEIVLVDLSSVESVFRCCVEIKERFDQIDLFFCNAGILSCESIDLWFMAKQMVFSPSAAFSSAGCLVQPVGKTTAEGLGETFVCNVFGHYVMIRELENLLVKANGSRIIWTSSAAAGKEYFDLEDYQAIKGKSPYESSKQIIDLIGVGLNSRFLNKHKISSFTTHPGVAATNILRGQIMGYGMTIGFYAARILGMRNQTITNWNGAYANYHVATKPIELLNTTKKYGSCCYRFGETYVDDNDVEGYNEVETQSLINKLETLLADFRNKYNVET